MPTVSAGMFSFHGGVAMMTEIPSAASSPVGRRRKLTCNSWSAYYKIGGNNLSHRKPSLLFRGYSFHVVPERIGIHRQDAFTQESLILIGQLDLI